MLESMPKVLSVRSPWQTGEQKKQVYKTEQQTVHSYYEKTQMVMESLKLKQFINTKKLKPNVIIKYWT